MLVRAGLLVGLSVIAAVDVGSALAAQAGELIERTLAIVGGQVLTLSDARAAVTLGLLGFVTDRMFRWSIYTFAGKYSPAT